MLDVGVKMPIQVIAPFFVAIGERNWNKFCELEKDFVAQHGVEAWQYEFNFRIKPALDKDSDRWLLIQWCGGGVVEMEAV
ncbi:MAG: hypothetical protein AAFY76_21375 [Cyanobacteria bacterium J06649_11]